MKHARSAACAALLWALGGLAQATPLTYYFSGTFSIAEGSLSALTGQSYNGIFEYDSAATSIFTGGNFRQYRMPAGSLAAGAINGSGATSILGLPDNPASSLMNIVWESSISSGTLAGTGDYIYASGSSVSSGTWGTVAIISLILLDTTGTVLGDTLSPLPSPLPDLASWSDTEFQVFDEGGNRAAGALNCLSTDSAVCASNGVPEPGTLAMLGLALAGLGFARRR